MNQEKLFEIKRKLGNILSLTTTQTNGVDRIHMVVSEVILDINKIITEEGNNGRRNRYETTITRGDGW